MINWKSSFTSLNSLCKKMPFRECEGDSRHSVCAPDCTPRLRLRDTAIIFHSLLAVGFLTLGSCPELSCLWAHHSDLFGSSVICRHIQLELLLVPQGAPILFKGSACWKVSETTVDGIPFTPQWHARASGKQDQPDLIQSINHQFCGLIPPPTLGMWGVMASILRPSRPILQTEVPTRLISWPSMWSDAFRAQWPYTRSFFSPAVFTGLYKVKQMTI